MNDNTTTNRDQIVEKEKANAILFEAESDAPFARHFTLEQRREQLDSLAVDSSRKGLGPLQRIQTYKDSGSTIVITTLNEAADTIPAEIRSLDQGEQKENTPSIEQPETPSRQGPGGITGYTSDFNQQFVPVKDPVDMCANSETHQNRGQRGSREDSLTSPNGNERGNLQVPSNRRGSRQIASSINGDNIFGQSDAGTASVSRTTFPQVNLGINGGGERGNVLVQQATSQSHQRVNQGQISQDRADRPPIQQHFSELQIEKLNLEQNLSKILYGLLQQIELVKYLLSSESVNDSNNFWTNDSPEEVIQQLSKLKWQQAGQRLINTIMKSSEGQVSVTQNRAQIHSIESQSVKEIFMMLNNFAVLYLQSQDSANANVILQCAAQIYQNYPEIKSSSSLASMLYSNLSLYHLGLSCSNPRASGEDDERASKYMDGAIIANKRTEEELAQAVQNEQVTLPRKTGMEISLAISYNNKAVIELKRKSFESSKLFSLKTVEMIEPRVFGMVQAELVSRVNQAGQVTQRDQNQQIFQELLQVLLIGYFNLAMSQDRELSSRALYLRGMQLCFQYMPGGRNNYLFKKFEKKYTRKMYALLEARRMAPAQVSDLDPRQDLPDILPLNTGAAVQPSEGRHSQVSPNFQDNLDLGARRDPVQLQPRPQRQGDERSFTMLDSERQSAVGGNLPQRILLSDSVASMPCATRQGLSASNGKVAYDRAARNDLNPRPQGAALRKPPPQTALHALHSETVQPAVRRTLAGERSQRGALAARGGAASPMRGKTSQKQPSVTSTKGTGPKRHMPADGRVQELVPSGEGLEDRSLDPPQLSKKFDSKGVEGEEHIPLRIGPQQTQPSNPGAGLASQANEANMNFARMGTMQPRQAELPQIREACAASAEESRALSLGPRETLTTAMNRFSKITAGDKTFAEDLFSQEAERPSLTNPEARPRSDTLGIGEEAVHKVGTPAKESGAQSHSNAALAATLQTPLFCKTVANDADPGSDAIQSPPLKAEGEEWLRKDDVLKQDVEQRVAEAVREKELAMEREFEAKMKAVQEEHAQYVEALRKQDEIKKESKEFSSVLSLQTVQLTQEAKREASKKSSGRGSPMAVIEEVDSPPQGRNRDSPMPTQMQMAQPQKSELQTEVVLSSAFDNPLGERKRESSATSIQDPKSVSNTQPGLGDFSQFASPTDDVEKAEYQQRQSPVNEDPGADRNDQGFQQAHVAGLNNKIADSKTMELWMTRDTTRFPAQKPQVVQQRRPSRGSSPEGAHCGVVGAGGSLPDDGAQKPVLNLGAVRENGRPWVLQNQAADQVFNSRGDARSGNQQFFLSLDKFIRDFNEADEEQFLKNLADLRSKCFNEESIQWKFLLTLREHYRLFRPQNIWRFQLRFLQSIKDRQTITCSKIVPQLEVTDTSITVKRYFKVTIEVSLQNEEGSGEVSLADVLRESLGSELQSLLEDRIQLTLSAEPEASEEEARQLQVPQESLSLLLLQTLLYKFSHLEAIDPSTALSCGGPAGQATTYGHHLMGSTPFYHIETFEDLCQHVVYPFVEISSPDQEWTSRRRSVDSQAQSARALARGGAQSGDQLSIEFCDIPQGLFVEPLMIAFLLSPDQASGATGENEIDPADSNANSFTGVPAGVPLSQNCQTQGGGSASPPLPVGNRQVASGKANCQIDVHHIHATSFKVTIKPIFHTQTFVLKKMLSRMDPGQMSNEDAKHWSEIQQNNELLLNLQPNNTNNLIIDLELLETSEGKTKIAPPDIFEQLSYSKFSAPPKAQETRFASYGTIVDSKTFFEKRLKRFIDALEERLREEFKDYLENQSPNELLNQDLLSLIVGAKVVYCSLGIKAKGSSGTGKALKPNYDEMYVVLRGAKGSSQDDLKIFCLFAESGSNNQVRATTQDFETRVSTVSEIFGQALDLSSTLQDQYILANLCKVYLKTISWEFQKPEGDSESSEGSLNGDDSDDDSLSASESDDEGDGSGEEGGLAARWQPCITSKDIEHMCTQRRLVMQKDGPVAITFTLLAIREGRKMLGVRAVALNSATMHESGVFFHLDQMSWKENMKKYQDVAVSVKKHMLNIGFEYILNNCLKLVPNKDGGYQLTLIDERMPTLEGHAETTGKDCTITQLERYLIPDKIYKILKEKEDLKTK